ncbi:hypothetical protein [Hymenobacter metallicola]|uniref:Uncharacterized protein n=1 Tax=Hymenobacter metallicola TaxID=2563114 RepID=A0A4Z0QBN0_9BACT|nr:hypothetical protein [Hymenobacter metallicola]TGE27440.1 hypothetical protein E5K02_13765 [Hymenobacter metallicola]
MKLLLRAVLLMLVGGCWPVLAYAGEKDVKATFLLVGGLGGLLIGAGLYALLLVLAAVFVRPRLVLAAVLALCTGLFGYIQYWSFYFLAIATRFLRTHQMRYEFGELPPLLQWGLGGVVLWGLLVLVVALRMWQSQQRRLLALNKAAPL